MRHPPDQDFLQSLQQRLLCGDRLAPEEFLRLLLPYLMEEMIRKFPQVDEHQISDGVIDALLDHSIHPQHFDAGKGVPLDRFLALTAWRNVDNLLLGERRRQKRERKVGSEKPEADVASDPVARNIHQEELQQLDEKQAAMFDALDNPKDKKILAMRLEGVRDTAAFASVLRIDHLSPKRQREEVKRHKDRITRFLRRKGLLP